MSSHSAVREAIAAALESIPGIGRVHRYEPYAANDKTFRDLYLTNGKLLGWHIRRLAFRQSQPIVGRWDVTAGWEVRGFMALGDSGESELIFDELLDLIGLRIRGDSALAPAVAALVSADGQEFGQGIALQESGPVMFAGVLCHSARLQLFTRHFE